MTTCPHIDFVPYGSGETPCVNEDGHRGDHEDGEGHTWPNDCDTDCEDAGPALCTQNGRGDKATPQPHDFPDVDGGPSRCLWCAVPAEGITPGYRTPDGREWTLAAVSTEDGLPLYEAPFVGTRYTAQALTDLHGAAEPMTDVTPPPYVHNARNVNRRPGTAVKHIPDRTGTTTICPRAHQATAPMPAEEAALLPLCAGCRDAARAAADLT